jgi:hypothetical protein
LNASDQETVFIEAGSSKDAIRDAERLKRFATEASQSLRVGAIIDRDFKAAKQGETSSKDVPVLVLPCHEVENLFLEPASLELIARRNGHGSDIRTLIQACSDKTAGTWIFQRAMHALGDIGNPESLHAARNAFGNTLWSDFQAQPEQRVEELLAKTIKNPDQLSKLKPHALSSAKKYGQLRVSEDLWKECMGKQVLAHVAHRLGFSGIEFLEHQLSNAWRSGEVAIPAEIAALRKFVREL